MGHLGIAVHLKAFPNIGFSGDCIPQGDVNHVNGCPWVSLFDLSAVEVPNEGADLKLDDLLALDSFNEPLVDVQLLLPFNLLLHEGPGAGELVIGDDNPLWGFLLQVDGPADGHAVHVHKQAFFIDVLVVDCVFHVDMDALANELPAQVSHICFDHIIVLFSQPSHSGWTHQLCDAILGCAL